MEFGSWRLGLRSAYADQVFPDWDWSWEWEFMSVIAMQISAESWQKHYQTSWWEDTKSWRTVFIFGRTVDLATVLHYDILFDTTLIYTVVHMKGHFHRRNSITPVMHILLAYQLFWKEKRILKSIHGTKMEGSKLMKYDNEMKRNKLALWHRSSEETLFDLQVWFLGWLQPRRRMALDIRIHAIIKRYTDRKVFLD